MLTSDPSESRMNREQDLSRDLRIRVNIVGPSLVIIRISNVYCRVLAGDNMEFAIFIQMLNDSIQIRANNYVTASSNGAWQFIPMKHGDDDLPPSGSPTPGIAVRAAVNECGANHGPRPLRVVENLADDFNDAVAEARLRDQQNPVRRTQARRAQLTAIAR